MALEEEAKLLRAATRAKLIDHDKGTAALLVYSQLCRMGASFSFGQFMVERKLLSQMALDGLLNNLEAREVLDLFEGHTLRLVLQGHLHYLEDLFIQGKTHFITGGAVSSAWWKGKRHGLEEGFLYITVEGEDFDWEYIDFGWTPENQGRKAVKQKGRK